MDEQGCSVVSVDVDEVLDRLTGLQSVITSERIRQALEATGRLQQRACQLSHEVMLWVVVAMGLLTHLPIRQVFKHARRMRLGGEDAGAVQPLRGAAAVGGRAGALLA